MSGHGQITDQQVAGYLAKYATKSTEITGHQSPRLTDYTIDVYADPDGSHVQRLVDACWTLGGPRWPVLGPTCARICLHRSCVRIAQPPAWKPALSGPVCRGDCRHRSCAEIRTVNTDPAAPWRRLRRWAHMLGFGGHFLTKSRTYSVSFAILRGARVAYRRTQTTGPEPADRAPEQETTLVVNFLQFVGAGWHTTADAILANTSAAMAREHQDAATQYLTATAA